MRVSDIMSASGLTDPWWFTAESRERGKTVHYIGEQTFRRQPVSVAPEFEGYATALRDAMAALGGFEVTHVEQRLHHPTRPIDGRPDALGFFTRDVGRIRRGPAIADIKSGARQPAHGIQLSLYETLANADPCARDGQPEDMKTSVTWTQIGIYVEESGRYKIHCYSIDPVQSRADRAAAAAALTLVEWRIRNGLIETSGVAEPEDGFVPAV